MKPRDAPTMAHGARARAIRLGRRAVRDATAAHAMSFTAREQTAQRVFVRALALVSAVIILVLCAQSPVAMPLQFGAATLALLLLLGALWGTRSAA